MSYGSTTTITVTCPAMTDIGEPTCNQDFELEVYIEPADSNYGADADGNRGIYVGPYAIEPEVPQYCPKCHKQYDSWERYMLQEQITKQIEKLNQSL